MRRSERTLLLAGAALVAASGGVHLYLYLNGYSHIPTIGSLFLLQTASALSAGIGLAATAYQGKEKRAAAASLAALGLVLGTLAGYLVSLHVALFGFREVPTTAGVLAGAFELAAALALGLYLTSQVRDRRVIQLPLAAFVAAAAILLALGNLGGPAAAASSKLPSGSSKNELTVTIKNFAFHPADPHVRPGEKILIVNDDPVAHTFTAVTKKYFNSGLIAPHGRRVVQAPMKPGRYPFFCLIHQFMTGVLVVS